MPDSPPTERPSRNAEARTPGDTTTAHNQSQPEAAPQGRGGAEPQLPHERDESSHGQSRGTEEQVPVGRQAHADVVAGRQDTDRGPVLDEVYNRTLAPDRGAKPPSR